MNARFRNQEGLDIFAISDFTTQCTKDTKRQQGRKVWEKPIARSDGRDGWNGEGRGELRQNPWLLLHVWLFWHPSPLWLQPQARHCTLDLLTFSGGSSTLRCYESDPD